MPVSASKTHALRPITAAPCHAGLLNPTHLSIHISESRVVSYFPGAAVRSHHKLRILLFHSFGGCKSQIKVSTGPSSIQSLQGGSLLPLPDSQGLLVILGSTQHRSKAPLFLPCSSVCLSLSHWTQSPPKSTSISFPSAKKTYFRIRSHSEVLGGYEFWRALFNPLQAMGPQDP